MAAFCDLNILWQKDRKLLLNNVTSAVKLGYEIIVINNVVEELKGKKSKIKEKQEVIPIKSATEIVLDKSYLASIQERGKQIEQYTRFSTVIEDAAQTHKLQQHKEIMTYDIIAVQPTTEKTFMQACSTLDIDVISMDFSQKLPFYLKRQTVGMAIERGIHFEILYSPTVCDVTARRNIIANSLNLIRICKGKNIIISSGCEKAMHLRGPYDVQNFALLFGLTEAQAKDVITRNCRAVLMHANCRKTTNCVIGITKVLDIAERDLWKVKRDCLKKQKKGKGNQSEIEKEEPSSKRLKLK